MLKIRHIDITDLPDLLKIQAACYPDYYWETEASFLAKINRQPQVSYLCENQDGVLAYFICTLADKQTFPSFNTITEHTENPTFFYCHDMAVLPSTRGLGIARLLVEHAQNKAKEHAFDSICLIAVNAINCWKKLGFVTENPAKFAIEKQVASFGNNALFMVKKI